MACSPVSGSHALFYSDLTTTLQGFIIPFLGMRNWGCKSHSWDSNAGFLPQGSLVSPRFPEGTWVWWSDSPEVSALALPHTSVPQCPYLKNGTNTTLSHMGAVRNHCSVPAKWPAQSWTRRNLSIRVARSFAGLPVCWCVLCVCTEVTGGFKLFPVKAAPYH